MGVGGGGGFVVSFLELFKIVEAKCLETRIKHVPKGHYFISDISV